MYGHTSAVHHLHMAQKVTPRFRQPARYRLTYLRQYRERKGLTLEQLADRIGTTHATLSRIERGLQPYSQTMLEALAEELDTDPASIIMRDPTDPEGIWSVWDKAKPGERAIIVDLAKTITKTGTN